MGNQQSGDNQEQQKASSPEDSQDQERTRFPQTQRDQHDHCISASTQYQEQNAFSRSCSNTYGNGWPNQENTQYNDDMQYQEHDTPGEARPSQYFNSQYTESQSQFDGQTEDQSNNYDLLDFYKMPIEVIQERTAFVSRDDLEDLIKDFIKVIKENRAYVRTLRDRLYSDRGPGLKCTTTGVCSGRRVDNSWNHTACNTLQERVDTVRLHDETVARIFDNTARLQILASLFDHGEVDPNTQGNILNELQFETHWEPEFNTRPADVEDMSRFIYDYDDVDDNDVSDPMADFGQQHKEEDLYSGLALSTPGKASTQHTPEESSTRNDASALSVEDAASILDKLAIGDTVDAENQEREEKKSASSSTNKADKHEERLTTDDSVKATQSENDVVELKELLERSIAEAEQFEMIICDLPASVPMTKPATESEPLNNSQISETQSPEDNNETPAPQLGECSNAGRANFPEGEDQ